MDDNLKTLYDAYVEAGRELFNALQPTAEEIKFINDGLIDAGIEDFLCEPSNPTAGGDVGFLAANVYEMRDAEANQ